MSVENFIPELWSTRLNQMYRKALVYGNLVNRDYEGEIRNQGDTVRINQLGDPTVGDYTPNVTTITPQALEDYQTTLVVDKMKYVAFYVDNVDQAQANVDVMDQALQNAAYVLAEQEDRDIAALYTDAGYTSSVVSIDSTNVHEALLLASQKLSENNVPKVGRWIVVPPWVSTKLSLAKVLVQDSGAAASAFSEGFQGRCAGFDVYESNNVPVSGSTYYLMAGTARAISYAGQIVKTVAYNPENSFRDAVKMLRVYGAKVIYPDALVVIAAQERAEP